METEPMHVEAEDSGVAWDLRLGARPIVRRRLRLANPRASGASATVTSTSRLPGFKNSTSSLAFAARYTITS